MTLISLLEALQFPEQVRGEVLSRFESAKQFDGYIGRLCDPLGYNAAYAELKEKLIGDEKGFMLLTVMLCAALESYKLYKARKICDGIFIDTMKCFPRFVNEHKESYGCYGFDRGFWTGRQLSLSLFRIGTLEYELAERNDISIHIPSGADLSDGALSQSISAAQRFFKEQNVQTARYVCGSWLLSPALKEVLPKSSKIIAFQNKFELLNWNEESDGYKLWVFKKGTLSPEEFPENTSLQRALKAYVLGGGKVGSAFGVLKL